MKRSVYNSSVEKISACKIIHKIVRIISWKNHYIRQKFDSLNKFVFLSYGSQVKRNSHHPLGTLCNFFQDHIHVEFIDLLSNSSFSQWSVQCFQIWNLKVRQCLYELADSDMSKDFTIPSWPVSLIALRSSYLCYRETNIHQSFL